MPRGHLIGALVVLLAACAEPAPPYLGDWSPLESATDVSQLTTTYEAVDSVTFRATMDNQTFEFRTDGSEVETPWGGTIAVRAVDSTTWESVMRVGGQLISTDTIRVSEDGQALSMVSHNSASGSPVRSEMQMTRVSGGPGLAGVWRAASMSGGMLADLSIAAAGDSGLDLRFSGMNATCSPTFAGGDAPASSPMFDGNWTCSIAQDSAGGLSMTWKRDGDPRYTSMYSVSANGDTLREVTTATGANEPVTVVYTRKSATP